MSPVEFKKHVVTRNGVGREASNHGHCRISMGGKYVPLNYNCDIFMKR